MYHEFYGLNRMPFQGSPDPDFLYPGSTHREALATLEYGVEAGMGFILLTGEVGLGKTTLIRTFLQRAERPDLFVIYVFHPLLSFEELLTVMAEELALELADRRPYHLMRSIQRDLIKRFEAGQRVVLIIDEAHRLPEATIENLRLVSNLETDRAKLLQIVIVGQPELESLLATPRLRQLNQRITLRARLAPLSHAESEAYIRHRLQRAGALVPDDAIAPSAIREISRRARGVPRSINNLATLALIHGFGVGERPIEARRVRAAAARPRARAGLPSGIVGRPRASRWLTTIGAGLAAGALGAAAVAALDDGPARAWLFQRAGIERPETPAPERIAAVPPAPAAAIAEPEPDRVVTPPVADPAPPPRDPADAIARPATTPCGPTGGCAPARDDAQLPATTIAASAPTRPPTPPSAAPPAPAPSPAAPVSGPLREAQQALRQLGYDPGPIDGVMGKLTAQALNAFQHDRALPETGTLTAATARQLALPN